MAEHSRFWDSTSPGDASDAPYDFGTELSEVLSALTGAEGVAGHGGVFRDVLNKLACTTAGTVQVTVATGLGLSYGGWYYNDAPLNIAIATPASATRVDRIVLRKSWSAQTVRLTRIVGVEGAGAPALTAGTPAYTQTVGTTWDVPLFQVSITTGGAITISLDERVYLPVHGNQNAEGGTKHAYGQISGTPTFSATVTDVTPGAAGVVGASGTISDGAHVHHLVADLYALRAADQSFGAAYGADNVLQLAVPAAGTYEFHGMLVVNGSGISVAGSLFTFSGTTVFIQYGYVGLDAATSSIGMIYAGSSDMGLDGVDRTIPFHGTLVCSTVGTLAHQGRLVSGSGFTVRAGSYMILKRLY